MGLVLGRAVLENGGAGNQNIGAGLNALLGGLRVDAAVDLEVDGAAGGVDHLAHFSDFIERRDEGLSAEAGIDGHHQNKIGDVHDMRQRLHRRAGVDGDARLFAERLDELHGTVQVRAGLGVDCYNVRAGLGEILDEQIDRRDHQVHVERFLGMRAQRLDHAGADGQVWDEVPVHDVDMDVIGPRRVDRAHFLAQFGEIGRQYRRGDIYAVGRGH